MIKTPSTTMIGGAGIWTPGCTVLGGQQNINQLIKSLFSDGTQGIYLNAQDAVSVSDLSSIKDLSGRNNHAEQPNATSRASLITDPSGYKSLKFDGVDDSYVTQSIDFTSTDKVTVIAGVRKMPATTVNMLCELSSSSSAENQANTFYLAVPETVSGTIFFRSRAALGSNQIAKAESGSGVRNCVITAKSDIPNDLNTVSIDGVLGTPSAADLGVGNLGNYPLYIGRRGGTSLPFNGQIYALLVIGKLLDDATIQRIEKEFAKYIGVTL